MMKIGRNDLCPCGSGRKYKHCCLIGSQSGVLPEEPRPRRVSLVEESRKILRAAAGYREKLYVLGVFILFADAAGDAWLLEVSDADAVQLARAGEPLEVLIDETPETIEIDWSHRFVVRGRELHVISHDDGGELLLEKAPTARISAAIRRIRKRYPRELLDRVHAAGVNR